MNKKKGGLNEVIKQGRPRFGKEAKVSKSLSLDRDVADWIDGTGGKANKILLAAMDKEDYDSQG